MPREFRIGAIGQEPPSVALDHRTGLSNACRDVWCASVNQSPIECVAWSNTPQEVSMTWLREQWLEALATCVTFILVAFVYVVFVHYVSGPLIAIQQASFAQIADR
jgi:hypothetical protein